MFPVAILENVTNVEMIQDALASNGSSSGGKKCLMTVFKI